MARECRKSAARWAWRFELVVVLTFKGGQWRGHSSQSDSRVEQATVITVAAGGASRARLEADTEMLSATNLRANLTAESTVAARTQLRAAPPQRSIALG